MTLAALSGACLRTTFTLTRAGSSISLRAEVEGDGYAEFAREEFQVMVYGTTPSHVHLEGRELTASGNRYVLPNPGTGFLLDIEV